MARAQVSGSPWPYALEALPLAFSAYGWQRCVLRSPPPDAALPLVGPLAHCRDRSAVCNSVPGRGSRGPSSTAYGARLGGGQQGFLPTKRSGPPICSQRRLSPFRRRPSTPQLGRKTCWTPPPPLHPRPQGGGLSGQARATGTPSAAPDPGVPPPTQPGSTGVGGAFVTVDSSDSSGSEDGGAISRIGLAKQGSAFALGPRVGAPTPRSNFQGRRRQGGHLGRWPDARPVLQARRGPPWSGGRFPASTDAHGSRDAGDGSFNGEGRGSCRRGR